MLDDFKNKIENLKAYDFAAELEKIVSENAEPLTELLREQLESGKGGDDKPSTVFGSTNYERSTISYKQQYGQGLGAVTDRITNYMTGAFYESLKEEVEGQVFEATSDVSYFDEIKAYSDESLLELSEPKRLEFAENVTLPYIKESFQQKTGFIIT